MNVTSEISSINQSGLTPEKRKEQLQRLLTRIKEAEKKKNSDGYDHLYNMNEEMINTDKLQLNAKGEIDIDSLANLTQAEKDKLKIEFKRVEIELKNREALTTLEEMKLIDDRKMLSETYKHETDSIKQMMKKDKDITSKLYIINTLNEQKNEEEMIKAKKVAIEKPVLESHQRDALVAQLRAMKAKRTLSKDMKFND